MRVAPVNVMVTLALGHLTAPSTVTFFVAFHVPSSLNHGPFADAPPPVNVVRHPKIAPRVGWDTTLPSPTGNLVTSTDATEVDTLVVGAPLAEVVATAPVVVAGTEFAGARFTFAFEPHADATMSAATHHAFDTRRPDIAEDRTVCTRSCAAFLCGCAAGARHAGGCDEQALAPSAPSRCLSLVCPR